MHRARRKSAFPRNGATGDLERPMQDPERVIAILLSDGWHQVKQGSFSLTAYSWGTGASWVDADTEVEIKCRMTAIQAVKQRRNGNR